MESKIVDENLFLFMGFFSIYAAFISMKYLDFTIKQSKVKTFDVSTQTTEDENEEENFNVINEDSNKYRSLFYNLK